MEIENVKNGELIVSERILQVYGLNINLPEEDDGVRVFFNSLVKNLNSKVSVIINETKNGLVCSGKKKINNVHVNDALNILLGCFDECHELNYDTNVITSVLSVFNTFRNMRMVSFTFLENSNMKDDYMKAVDMYYEGDKSEIFNRIYDITEMEIHLCDNIKKEIIDFINQMFMSYDYIPNDYMNRKFTLTFEYDEYVSFMEMVFSNNIDLMRQFGQDVVNYLLLFPSVIIENKPSIRIVTNYYDL